MDNLLAARCQMGMSFVFHIIFAAIGIAFPLMMVIAECLWLKTKETTYLTLAKRWAKGTAILFAIGAVSGTILSFELGLLWPNFMRWSGSIIGLMFAMEGFAFFGEAIFLGIYLYGWQRISPVFHVVSGLIVAICGAASAIFVVSANAWMNTPRGFKLVDGQPTDINPIAAMLNPSAAPEVIHMLISAYIATAILVAGIHAFLLLREPQNRFHQKAFLLSVCLASTMAIIQIASGDFMAKTVAQYLPVKFAALEGQFHTERGAPLRIGGIPDSKTETTPFAVEIPYTLSILAFQDPYATVKGLDSVPKEIWPPEPWVHLAFQAMVACGSWLALMAVWTFVLLIRKSSLYDQRIYLKAIVLTAPLGFVAIEAGWMVTELGRQPWIVYGIMKTAQAATPVPGVVVHLIVYSLIFLLLSAIVVFLMLKEIAGSPGPD